MGNSGTATRRPPRTPELGRDRMGQPIRRLPSSPAPPSTTTRILQGRRWGLQRETGEFGWNAAITVKMGRRNLPLTMCLLHAGRARPAGVIAIRASCLRPAFHPFPLSISFQEPHTAVTGLVHPSQPWPKIRETRSQVCTEPLDTLKAVASRSTSSPPHCFIAAASFPFTTMTEYDYSPAAYEKYINTQLRVSNWVSSQSDHTQNYGNPFVPSAYLPTKPLPQEQSSRKQTKSPARSRSSTTSAPSSTTTTPTKPTRQPHVRSHTTRDVHKEPRHTPIRSMTVPAYQQAMGVPGQTLVLPTSSRDRHDRNDKHRSSSHRSSNKSPSKSHHSSRHDRSRHHRSSSTSRAYTTDRDGSGRKFIHLDPDSRNKVVHLPPPQLGEQYVIIPPPGGKVELVVR